jgi:hypothetical protein
MVDSDEEVSNLIMLVDREQGWISRTKMIAAANKRFQTLSIRKCSTQQQRGSREYLGAQLKNTNNNIASSSTAPTITRSILFHNHTNPRSLAKLPCLH